MVDVHHWTQGLCGELREIEVVGWATEVGEYGGGRLEGVFVEVVLNGWVGGGELEERMEGAGLFVSVV